MTRFFLARRAVGRPGKAGAGRWYLEEVAAHAHVRTCPRNPARGELFDSKTKFPASQRKRVVEAVRGYLGASCGKRGLASCGKR